MTVVKDCVRCHASKLLSDFAHKDARTLRNWCRSCEANRMRKQRAKRREGIAIGVQRASDYLGRLLRQAAYYEELR